MCLWPDKAASLISEPPALPLSALFTSSLSSSPPPFLLLVFPFGPPPSPRAAAAACSSSLPPVALRLRLYSTSSQLVEDHPDQTGNEGGSQITENSLFVPSERAGIKTFFLFVSRLSAVSVWV